MCGAALQVARLRAELDARLAAAGQGAGGGGDDAASLQQQAALRYGAEVRS